MWQVYSLGPGEKEITREDEPTLEAATMEEAILKICEMGKNGMGEKVSRGYIVEKDERTRTPKV